MIEIKQDFISTIVVDAKTKGQLRGWLEKPETMRAEDVASLFNQLESISFFSFMEQIAARKAKKSEPAFTLVLYAEEMGVEEGTLKANLLKLKRLMEQKERFGIASCVMRGNENQRGMFDLVPGLFGVVDFSPEQN